ncbi:hypothetical protein D3C80_1923250 [compost metagenome]
MKPKSVLQSRKKLERPEKLWPTEKKILKLLKRIETEMLKLPLLKKTGKSASQLRQKTKLSERPKRKETPE